MELLWQVVVSGLAAGGVYGLVAIGQTLVFRLTGTVYLALLSCTGLSSAERQGLRRKLRGGSAPA